MRPTARPGTPQGRKRPESLEGQGKREKEKQEKRLRQWPGTIHLSHALQALRFSFPFSHFPALPARKLPLSPVRFPKHPEERPPFSPSQAQFLTHSREWPSKYRQLSTTSREPNKPLGWIKLKQLVSPDCRVGHRPPRSRSAIGTYFCHPHLPVLESRRNLVASCFPETGCGIASPGGHSAIPVLTSESTSGTLDGRVFFRGCRIGRSRTCW